MTVRHPAIYDLYSQVGNNPNITLSLYAQVVSI